MCIRDSQNIATTIFLVLICLFYRFILKGKYPIISIGQQILLALSLKYIQNLLLYKMGFFFLMGKGLEQLLLQARHTEGPDTYERCSASQAIREMQIKTTMRYHLTLVTVVNIDKSTDKCWRGCGEKGTLVPCCWECRLVQQLWKTVWNFLKKIKNGIGF